MRCKNGGKTGQVSMKVCKDAPKVANVGSSQRLFPEEPNPDDAKFCTVDKKLIPIENVMKPLINPKLVSLKNKFPKNPHFCSIYCIFNFRGSSKKRITSMKKSKNLLSDQKRRAFQSSIARARLLESRFFFIYFDNYGIYNFLFFVIL